MARKVLVAKDIEKRTGLSRAMVCRYFKTGRLKGKKVLDATGAEHWETTEEHLRDFLSKPRSPGKPRKRF